MAEKLTDRAAGFIGQAAAAAAPLKDKATELAGQAAAAAAPLAEQAKTQAAKGVGLIAGNLDKVTGGKYSDQINSVASKVSGAKSEAEPAIVTETDPSLNTEMPPLKPDA